MCTTSRSFSEVTKQELLGVKVARFQGRKKTKPPQKTLAKWNGEKIVDKSRGNCQGNCQGNCRGKARRKIKKIKRIKKIEENLEIPFFLGFNINCNKFVDPTMSKLNLLFCSFCFSF